MTFQPSLWTKALILMAVLVCTGLGSVSAEENPLGTYEGLKTALESSDCSLVVVDVRSRYMFSLGHIRGAVNVPLYTLLNFNRNPAELRDLSTTLVVVGSPVSPDSVKGWDLLSYRGFKNVVLFGPITKWKGELVK